MLQVFNQLNIRTKGLIGINTDKVNRIFTKIQIIFIDRIHLISLLVKLILLFQHPVLY
jgi:hypothetical protein